MAEQQQQSPSSSKENESNLVLEGIPELILHTPLNELMVLCETIIDFKILEENGLDFSKALELQGWKAFFERLTGPVYAVLVKQFWVHATAEKKTITSYVMNTKIVITKKSITDLISHDGKGKRIHSTNINARREVVIALIIFKEETNFEDEKCPSAKDLTRHLRVWFKCILGCIHHKPSTNSSDYLTLVKCSCYFVWRRVSS